MVVDTYHLFFVQPLLLERIMHCIICMFVVVVVAAAVVVVVVVIVVEKSPESFILI